jgi:hypothetical protein
MTRFFAKGIKNIFSSNFSACACLSGFLIIALACGQDRRAVDDLTTARDYLNKRQFDDAIFLLDDLYKSDPKNSKVLLLLSSALAGSVGLNAIDAFDALKDKLFDNPLGDRVSSNQALTSEPQSMAVENFAQGLTEAATEPDPKEIAIRKFDQEFLKFSAVLADTGSIMTNLPYVDRAARKRLVRGLMLLQEIPQDSQDYTVAQLYSGILSLLQFLNYIRDAVPFGQDKIQPWYFALYCHVDIAEFLKDLGVSSHYLAYAFTALNNARRASSNPVYANLELASDKLTQMEALRNKYFAGVNISSLAHRLSTYAYCHE